MNRIYKLVWNEISRTYIAVSETAKTSRSPTQSSTRLLCKNTDNRFAFRPGYLALVLAFSGQAAHAQITTQQRANGTNLVLDQPVNISLTATDSAGYALWAQNGGQITATTNQFLLASNLSSTLLANSGGKIILNGIGGLLEISNQTTSPSYPIVSVSGTGSEIDLTGALIHGNTQASSNQVYGVLVNSGASFKLNESRISLKGGTSDSQYGPAALVAEGAGTAIHLTNTQIDLQTVSTRDGAIRGIAASGQSTVTGDNITINMNSGTTGPQNAIQSNGFGTNITLSNLAINGTASARNYQLISAVQAFSGGKITLNGGSISGNGIVSALSSNMKNSLLTANDLDVSTTGMSTNQLVAAANGGTLNFTGGSITNNSAIGATTVIALVSNSVVNLKNTSVLLGYGSQNTTGGIALNGFGPSQITANNTQISVNSNSSSLRAIGAYTDSFRTDAQIQLSNGSSINLTGGYATTSGGLASYGVLVDGTRNVFTGSDSTITTARIHPTQGAGVTAVSVQNSGYGAGTANLTRMEINANGNDSIGISAIGDSAQINLFASNNITTNGTNAHGLTVQNGAVISGANATGSKVLAQGTGSNALYFSGAATNTATLSGTSLTSTQSTAINVASGRANISLDNGSVTSGNGTWLNVAAGAEANVTLGNGEYVKGITQMGATGTSKLGINTGSTWEITGASRLTSLAFDGGYLRFTANTPITTDTPVTLNTGGGFFNTNGLAIDFANQLQGTGQLQKNGAGTLTLSSANSNIGGVVVTDGTLEFTQVGAFITTGNYTTQTGATTQIGATNSTLRIGGTLTQQAGSHLVMELGSTPDITATRAVLGGDLAVAGFTFTGIPNLASAITNQDYTIIRTTNGITGDFTSVDGTPGVPGGGLDYLITSGHKANLDKDYVLGFEMAWMKGGQTRGTGDFTLAEGTGFTVDISLEDQTFAGGNSDLGWNGRDLTKKGPGRLNLSTLNTYTGTTTIEDGDLYLSDAGDIQSSSQVSLSSSNSTLNISLLGGNGTTISNLGGIAQSQVVLGTKQLTVSSSTDTTMAGNISGTGDLIKTGSNTLTLTGDNTYTGTTTISTGTLQIGDGATTGTLKSSGIANSASLIFNHNDDFEYVGILSGNGTLSKLGTGTLSLSHANSTQGSVSVEAGVLNFNQNGTFNVQGDYVTESNATTHLGANNSKLNITGTFTQKADSTLDVILGAEPDITAGSAKLGGNLVLSGFRLSDVPVKATELDQNPYTIIHTTSGITGDFSTHPSVVTGADYLVQKGSVSDNQMDYNLLLKLAWTQGGDAEGTGSFTMQSNTGLDVDISLTDQTPASFFVSGWDGRSLTKSGEGQLTLSTLNHYTGDTTITGGSLLLKGEGDISSSSNVTLRGSATGKTYLDISGISAPSTTLNNLSGTVDSQLTLGGKTLAINNNQNTIFAGNFDTSTGSITKTGAGELLLSGQTLWTGDTHLDQGSLTLDGSQGGGRLDSNIVGQTNTRLQLVNGAILTGWIDPTDVSLDNASTWNMSASSLVNHLTNAGKISILPPTGSSFSTLTIQGNYTGNNGLIVLNTKLGADDSATDKLIVNGNTSGTTQVKIKNTGGRGAQTSKGIEIIKVEGQSQGQFTLANRVVAGAYEYSLNQGQADLADGNWYLRSAGSKSKTPQFRPESGAYLGNQSLTDTMQMHTLYDRQGSRDTQANKKAWGRIISGQINSSSASKNVDMDSDYTLVQFGSDLFAVNDGKQLLQIGLMGSWGDGNTDTIGNADPYGKRHSAKGTVTGYSAGVYATWFADGQTREGAYADSWLQYGWYDNDVKSNGMKTKSYDAQRFTASVEAGYNFILGNAENETPLHLTPQAQIAYSRYRVDPLTDSHDTVIDGQNTNQWNSRLGVRASYSTNPLQPFVELNWLHSSQKQSVHFHDVQISQDKPKNLPELKLGFQGELSKKLSGWARISAQDDFKDYQRFEATAGILYVW